MNSLNQERWESIYSINPSPVISIYKKNIKYGKTELILIAFWSLRISMHLFKIQIIKNLTIRCLTSSIYLAVSSFYSLFLDFWTLICSLKPFSLSIFSNFWFYHVDDLSVTFTCLCSLSLAPLLFVLITNFTSSRLFNSNMLFLKLLSYFKHKICFYK